MVGNIDQFTRLEDIWNNDISRALQKDIMQDRKFTHCAVDRCGVLDYNITVPTHQLSINIDESCNLKCPSCRKNSIMITEGDEYQTKLTRAHHIVDLLEKFDQPCHIIMTGNGDPLASAIMRPLIHSWRPKANHTIRLFTNGLLLEKQLEGNDIMQHITEYMISIDAGSKEVYEKVRLGGSWDQLIRNFNWLKRQLSDSKKQTKIQFVLQKDNFLDLENFCELMVAYNFTASVTYLEDWGTWSQFSEHDVIGNTKHPDHVMAMHLLSRAIEKYHGDHVWFGSKLQQVVGYRKKPSDI
jgi:MoaA/NifB/PqqE/SkfB family radical SAM enzyme